MIHSDSLRTRPTVSAIIPTRNRSSKLRRAIDSVLRQTYQDFEIIVVSDGSTDDTEQAVASFPDARIRLITHESARGASAARNSGIRVARGKYLAFLDDDDAWLPDKLEIQVPVLDQAPAKVGLVYGWMVYLDQDGREVRLYRPEVQGDVFVEMLGRQAIGNSSTVMIRREVVETVGEFDENLPKWNDGEYWQRISKHFHVACTPMIVAHVYIGHMDRLSIDSRNNLQATIVAFKKRLQFFAEDYERHPQIKAKVLFRQATCHFRINEYALGYLVLREALSCKNGFQAKMSFIVSNYRQLLSGLLKSPVRALELPTQSDDEPPTRRVC